jgi:hypothetical protein
MKTFKYNPFPEIGSYVVYPEKRGLGRLRRILMDTIAYNPIPRFTSWIYQALRG